MGGRRTGGYGGEGLNERETQTAGELLAVSGETSVVNKRADDRLAELEENQSWGESQGTGQRPLHVVIICAVRAVTPAIISKLS
jgi:hypothetical protein